MMESGLGGGARCGGQQREGPSRNVYAGHTQSRAGHGQLRRSSEEAQRLLLVDLLPLGHLGELRFVAFEVVHEVLVGEVVLSLLGLNASLDLAALVWWWSACDVHVMCMCGVRQWGGAVVAWQCRVWRRGLEGEETRRRQRGEKESLSRLFVT